MHIDVLKTYHAWIENSVGSALFRNLYILEGGAPRDILENGNLSCAQFVSTILMRFGMCTSHHATVSGTLKDMAQSGWKETNAPKMGDVIHWGAESTAEKSDAHHHIGFYINEHTAISNDSATGLIARHHITLGINEDGTPLRNIIAIYTLPAETSL